MFSSKIFHNNATCQQGLNAPRLPLDPWSPSFLTIAKYPLTTEQEACIRAELRADIKRHAPLIAANLLRCRPILHMPIRCPECKRDDSIRYDTGKFSIFTPRVALLEYMVKCFSCGHRAKLPKFRNFSDE